MSLLSKFTNPETTSPFHSVKPSKSNRVNDLKIHNSIPITLHGNLLKFRDTDKIFELKGDLLKVTINKIYNVNHASLSDIKLMYEFANEVNFESSR